MDHFLINETQFDKAMSRETLQVNSFIRGYHEYMDVWVPNNGDECNLKREPRNVKDQNAVAVIRTVQNGGSNGTSLSQASHHVHHPNEMTDDFQVIGHVPKLMALLPTKFLKRGTNTGKAIIRGKRVNRGGGYGLEVLCEYQFTTLRETYFPSVGSKQS